LINLDTRAFMPNYVHILVKTPSSGELIYKEEIDP